MTNLIDNIDQNRIPQHVAIIMDGNGRWAKQRGKERLAGHAAGVESVRVITEKAAQLGVKYLTYYTFSTENWNRPQAEVNGLMEILVDSIIRETPTFHKNNIRLLAIGDMTAMPDNARNRLSQCMAETAVNTGMTMILALSYSARWEIVDATRRIAQDAAAHLINPDKIDEAMVARYLTTGSIPDPDLLIRTSGELRLSNFLLWQLAYTELYFTDTFWPDFREQEFYAAIIDYQKRERRFGKTSEQLL